MKQTSLKHTKIISLNQIGNRQGHISVVENNINIPFEIKRVFYIYDIPGGRNRGAHAHKECHQLLVAVIGGYQVKLDDGKQENIISPRRPDQALHIPPGVWASEINFTSGAICLVMASEKYDEEDYIRNYEEFKVYKNDS